MAWVAVHKNGGESIFAFKPFRKFDCWWNEQTTENDWYDTEIELPKGSIKKLIGRDLTWEDESVELKEDTEEMITISMEDYRTFLSYANYMGNWAPNAYKCPMCGTLNPRGYICIHCRYDVTK